MNRLIAGVIITALAGACLTGCSKTPLSATVTTTAASVSTSVAAQSGLLQSGLPLSIVEPQDAAVLASTALVVSGKTLAGASVAVNEASGLADAQGNFSIAVSLEEGPNALDISASDGQGRTGEIILMVQVDPSQSGTASASNSTQGIFVRIRQPLDGSIVKTGPILVIGQTTPGALVVIGEVTADADANGNFSLSIPMAEGLNLIDVQAMGSEGSQAEDFILVQAAP